MDITWRSFANVSLTNNDLTATLPTNLQSTIASGSGVSSGKWYWEIKIQSLAGVVGVTSTTTGGQIWNTDRHRGYLSGASKWGGTSGSAYGASYTQGDIISVLLDMDNGTIEFWKNGISQGVAFTGIKTLGTIFPFYGNPSGTSVPSTATACFFKSTFTYQIPQGYLPYELKNKILLSSGDRYSLKDSIVYKMEIDSENNFLNYGADSISNFKGYATKQKGIKSTSVTLGIGKAFEHTIDMPKRRVDKITLG